MTSLENNLVAAVRANASLRIEAEQLLGEYLQPGCDPVAVINSLIHLFDGPQQRDAKRLADQALEEAREAEASNGNPRVVDSWEAELGVGRPTE